MIKTNKKKKFSIKMLILFLIFELIFSGVTAPFIVYYGPFENLKGILVGTAMSTYKHQYIATAFLSKKRIDAILNRSTNPTGTEPVEASQQNVNDIKVNKNHDPNIERYDIQGKKFNGYLLVVKDPTRVKVGYTDKIGIQGQRTSEMAQRYNAVAAINGGGFTDKSSDGVLYAGTGAIPVGVLISNGKTITPEGGSTSDTSDIMGITEDGILVVGRYSLNELSKLKVKNAISFGPALVVNGKPQLRGDGGQGAQPRTAVGQRENGDMLLLVIDGRQGLKPGATLKEVQDIMLQYGARNATNLDGGSSATMYYDGEVINNPCDPLGERSIASIVYVSP